MADRPFPSVSNAELKAKEIREEYAKVKDDAEKKADVEKKYLEITDQGSDELAFITQFLLRGALGRTEAPCRGALWAKTKYEIRRKEK